MHIHQLSQPVTGVVKISKNFFSNITYITLSSNHVILKRQQVELPRHTKNTI